MCYVLRVSCYNVFVRTYRLPLILASIGLFIGLFFASQFNSNVLVGSPFPADQIEARDAVMKTFLDEQSFLQNRIVELRSTIEEQQKKNESLISTTKLSALDELKNRIGISALRGPGIRLVIDDSPAADRSTMEGDQSLVQAADIRDIVNLLWSSQAEGISINQQRMLATSPITAVGGSILINNFHITPPFVVTAIGDMEFMLQRLQDRNSLTELKKRAQQLKIPIYVSGEKQIALPAFSGNINLKYLQVKAP